MNTASEHGGSPLLIAAVKRIWPLELGIGGAMSSLAGRAIVAFFFLGAVRYHLSPEHFRPTLDEMIQKGVPFPLLGLAIGMFVSAAGAICLFLRIGGRWPTLVLALYSITVSWIIHNPLTGDPSDAFSFLKDFAICGALLILSANEQR